ncbi:MAG: hypothetical protein ACHQC8_02315 [Solirubrobacterales bacterium]
MSVVFAEAARAEPRISRQPVGWDLERGWPGVVTEPVGMPTRTYRVAPTPYGTTGNVYGEGFCYSPTQLPTLHFIGEREEDGDDGGEFAFAGLGTVGAFRNVFVRGTATRTFKIEQTPFLEGFHGHVTVSDDEYAWSVNTTSLYQVTGVVAIRPPGRRARYQKPSRAYDVFKELGAWLEMSDEELAPIVKVARGTVSRSWKNGTEPRKREQARRLFQLHGLASALHSVLGDRLAVWLKRGSPCPLKLLEMGDIDRFERLADEVIFAGAGAPRPRLDTAWPPSTAGKAPTNSTLRMKPATRARSKRLSSDRQGANR